MGGKSLPDTSIGIHTCQFPLPKHVNCALAITVPFITHLALSLSLSLSLTHSFCPPYHECECTLPVNGALRVKQRFTVKFNHFSIPVSPPFPEEGLSKYMYNTLYSLMVRNLMGRESEFEWVAKNNQTVQTTGNLSLLPSNNRKSLSLPSLSLSL